MRYCGINKTRELFWSTNIRFLDLRAEEKKLTHIPHFVVYTIYYTICVLRFFAKVTIVIIVNSKKVLIPFHVKFFPRYVYFCLLTVIRDCYGTTYSEITMKDHKVFHFTNSVKC